MEIFKKITISITIFLWIVMCISVSANQTKINNIEKEINKHEILINYNRELAEKTQDKVNYQIEEIINENQKIIENLIIEYDIDNEVQQIIDGWGSDWDIDIFEATFYAPLDNKSGICADSNPTSTSTGTYPQQGTFAVDPNIIKYNSEIIIIGDNWIEAGKALDTGGAIRNVPEGNLPRIDIFVETHEEAMRRGREIVLVIWK